MKRFFHFFCCVALVLSVVVSPLFSGLACGDLNSIEKIRSQSLDVSDKGRAVELTAQVVRIDARLHGFFLFDGSSGIYVTVKPGSTVMKKLQLGDIVHVEGQSTSGYFAPSVSCSELTIIENRPLPEGRIFQNVDRLTPSVDCDWVLVKGRLMSMEVFPAYDTIMLEVIRDDVVLDVQVNYSKENKVGFQNLMFQWVRFQAVLGTVFNPRRQAVGRVLHANGVETFELVTGYDYSRPPRELELHELMRFGTTHRQEVITKGVVTAGSGRELYVRGTESSIKVLLPESMEFSIGDRLQLSGFIWPEPLGPVFRARSVGVLRHGESPVPLRVKMSGSVDPNLHCELIELEAHLIERGKVFGHEGAEVARSAETFLCRSGTLVFEVRMPAGIAVAPSIRPGALLKLTGICTVLPDTSVSWRLMTDGLQLELRSADDIEVLEAGPWWTPAHSRWAVWIVSGALTLFLLWIFFLRRTVLKQTAVISEKVERETILTERQRIARELHDNVEQGLAGAVIQVGACRKLQALSRDSYAESCQKTVEQLPEDQTALKQHLEQQAKALNSGFEKSCGALDVVENMLTHCSAESRASILELRGGLLERMDLVEAIRASIEPLARECGAALELTVEGASFRLKRQAERNLLLTVKEAVSNAARHAKPETICVVLRFSEDALRMRITDDGCGFDVNRLSKSGRFGLLGMHERINKLKGRILVDSSPGRGTSVDVELPLENDWKQV